MKTKNLLVSLSIGLLSLVSLVGCGIDEHHVVQQGDKNIESIEVDADTVPTTPIKVGTFDDAGITFTVNYSDGSKDENLPVTSEMVPEEYQHYLHEPGTVTLNIAFRGTQAQPVTTTLTVEFDLYHLQYTTWTGMSGEERVYSNYKAINYATVEELALYKTPTGLDTTVDSKFYKWSSWDFDKNSIASPIDKTIHPIYEDTHPVSISINEDTIPEEGIKFDKFDEAGITMTVAYSDTTINTDVPVLTSLLEDASELTEAGTDGVKTFKVLYYNDTLSDTFDLEVKSYYATYYALTEESTSSSDQKLVKTTGFRTPIGDLSEEYPELDENVTISTGVTYKHIGWDVSEITTLVDTPVHATYDDAELYTVNFYKGDSTLISSQLVESGEDAVEPSAIERAMTNFAFYAWDRSYQDVSKNLNIYGIYFEIEHELTGYTLVSFVTVSDEPSFSCLVKTGELVPEPVEPVEEGFEGWYKEATFDNKWDFDADVATGSSITLYAHFIHVHHYGDPTYDWNDDYSECVASKACTTPGCTEKITETASGNKVIFIEDTPATCTEDAKGHNHAEFTNTSFVAQDSPTNSVTKEDSALGHDPLLINGQPATSEAEGWKDYYQCQTCEEYFEDINCEVPISNVNTWKTGRGLIYKTNDVIVPTTSSDNWEVASEESACKVVFGSGMGAHPSECAEFKNYQYTGWEESQLGITATFTNSDKASVNNISFTYYLWRDTGGTEIKADLTITISIIDNLGNKVEIDSFVIDKAESSAWINYSKNLKLINFDKLVIETKSELVTLPKEKGINNQFYVCNLKLKSYPFGDVNISTTDESVWTYEATHSENNRIVVGSKPTWNETGGEYLALRAYQWSGWGPTEAGLTAKYTNATPKLVNKLEFKYFINSGSFIAPEATIKIYVLSNGVETLIDTITLNKDTVTMDSDLDHSTTFDDLLLSELHIELTTNAPEGTEGDTIVFFKGIAASYVS